MDTSRPRRILGRLPTIPKRERSAQVTDEQIQEQQDEAPAEEPSAEEPSAPAEVPEGGRSHEDWEAAVAAEEQAEEEHQATVARSRDGDTSEDE
jgi:hypothetical protein